MAIINIAQVKNAVEVQLTTFSVSCAAGPLHIYIAITHVIIVLGTVESHMPYMTSEYMRRIGTKNSGTCTHFKLGTGLGSRSTTCCY